MSDMKCSEDLSKVLRYEMSFIRDAQDELIKHAQIIMDQAKAANKRLDELTYTLSHALEGKEWRRGS